MKSNIFMCILIITGMLSCGNPKTQVEEIVNEVKTSKTVLIYKDAMSEVTDIAYDEGKNVVIMTISNMKGHECILNGDEIPTNFAKSNLQQELAHCDLFKEKLFPKMLDAETSLGIILKNGNSPEQIKIDIDNVDLQAIAEGNVDVNDNIYFFYDVYCFNAEECPINEGRYVQLKSITADVGPTIIFTHEVNEDIESMSSVEANKNYYRDMCALKNSIFDEGFGTFGRSRKQHIFIGSKSGKKVTLYFDKDGAPDWSKEN